jgi:hypothetical protein
MNFGKKCSVEMVVDFCLPLWQIANPQLLPEQPQETHLPIEETKHIDVDVDAPEEDEIHTIDQSTHNELSQENNTNTSLNVPQKAYECVSLCWYCNIIHFVNYNHIIIVM